MIEIKALASSSRGNCYRITDGITPILVECGMPFKEIQRGLSFKTSEISACFVSHEHQDHAKAAKDVLKAGIDLYASSGTIEALRLAGHRLNPIQPKAQLIVGSWTIMPFDVQHDAAEPMGFLLGNQAGDKLLFATDTFYLKYKFPGLTHIMIECNYSNGILNKNVESGAIPLVLKNRLVHSHMSLETLKEFLTVSDLSRVQEIWLIHLSAGNSDAELFKREIQELTGKIVIVAGE